MALKFQINKTELQRINKELKIRVAALPTLKNKESALRAEIKKHKKVLAQMSDELEAELKRVKSFAKLFTEYPDLVTVEEVITAPQKIAGVKIPTFKEVKFKIGDFSYFQQPSWIVDGIEIIQKISILKIKIKVEKKRIGTLELARKKTTQKVNLYEKVQIPAYQEAIIKIKRFLEDTENLDRASQKIVKKKKVQIL